MLPAFGTGFDCIREPDAEWPLASSMLICRARFRSSSKLPSARPLRGSIGLVDFGMGGLLTADRFERLDRLNDLEVSFA
jgi:hypothetical protein